VHLHVATDIIFPDVSERVCGSVHARRARQELLFCSTSVFCGRASVRGPQRACRQVWTRFPIDASA